MERCPWHIVKIKIISFSSTISFCIDTSVQRHKEPRKCYMSWGGGRTPQICIRLFKIITHRRRIWREGGVCSCFLTGTFTICLAVLKTCTYCFYNVQDLSYYVFPSDPPLGLHHLQWPPTSPAPLLALPLTLDFESLFEIRGVTYPGCLFAFRVQGNNSQDLITGSVLKHCQTQRECMASLLTVTGSIA